MRGTARRAESRRPGLATTHLQGPSEAKTRTANAGHPAPMTYRWVMMKPVRIQFIRCLAIQGYVLDIQDAITVLVTSARIHGDDIDGNPVLSFREDITEPPDLPPDEVWPRAPRMTITRSNIAGIVESIPGGLPRLGVLQSAKVLGEKWGVDPVPPPPDPPPDPAR